MSCILSELLRLIRPIRSPHTTVCPSVHNVVVVVIIIIIIIIIIIFGVVIVVLFLSISDPPSTIGVI